MREIKFRLRHDNKIIGYEKWYQGYRTSHSDLGYKYEDWSAHPCWLYSVDGKYWNSKPPTGLANLKDEYTGLKDKNGKEIYEGDVVRWVEGAPWNPEEPISLVGSTSFDNGGWWIDCVQSNSFNGYLVDVGCEVIGNLYENPELIAG